MVLSIDCSGSEQYSRFSVSGVQHLSQVVYYLEASVFLICEMDISFIYAVPQICMYINA